ncbi:MAG: molybdopterin-guanine dinucleotide biosynthesis protein B [Magnetococcales bacterium]|nr:molybdopterin-guanine dinucleotide biosynthesis protein B [Magnetococcales bacterium]
MAAVIGFIAPSGSGKTTLMEQVITILVGQGWRVAAIKQGHHDSEPDVAGKDSYRFRHAGARTVLFTGPQRWFMIQECDQLPLSAHLARLTDEHDLVIIEGGRDHDHAKIAVHRQHGPASTGSNWWFDVRNIVAIASDDPHLTTDLQRLPLNDPDHVAHFIIDHLRLQLQSPVA